MAANKNVAPPAAALLVLHLSVTLSALLHMWSRYLALRLHSPHRFFRMLLRLRAWAASAIAVAGLADAAAITVEVFRPVVGMLLTFLLMAALFAPFDLWVH